MRHLFVVNLFCVSIGFLIENAEARVSYVDAHVGDDGNPGTEGSPWATVGKAAATLEAGDTVIIRPGLYEEHIYPPNSGQPGRAIVYQGANKDAVIIQSPNTEAYDCTICLEEAHHLVFRNLTLKGANYANFSAYDESLEGRIHHLLLENLVIDGTGDDHTPEGLDQYTFIGVSFTGVRDSEIRNCVIRNNQFNLELSDYNEQIIIQNNKLGPSLVANRYYDEGTYEEGRRWSHNLFLYSEGRQGKQNTQVFIIDNRIHHAEMQGILVWRANHVHIRGNHAHNNGSTGIQIESDHVTTPGRTTEYIVVEDNTSEWNSQKYEGGEAGIWIDDSSYVLVRNNVSRFNEMGIHVTGSHLVIVRHNIVDHNAPSELIAQFPFYSDSGGIRAMTSPNGRAARDNIIIHNTFYKNGLANQRGQIHLGQWDSWPEGLFDSVFKNNIVSEGQEGRYDFNLNLQAYGKGLEVDSNVWFNSMYPLHMQWQVDADPWEDCENCQTWAQYHLCAGLEPLSNVIDPLFEAPEIGDFRLASASPCEDAATFLTTTTGFGSGTVVEVADARYFSDGYGTAEGDLMRVGSNPVVQIMEVDYSTNTITVDRPICWQWGDGVTYDYKGLGPDIGAKEND